MRALLFLATLLALPAVAREPPARLTVTVDLTYRERIALPPGTTAEAVLNIGGRPVARASAAPTGQQVPLRLLLEVPRTALTATEAEIAGRIAPPAGAAWTGSRRVTLDPAAPRAELGPLLLTRAAAPARETRFDCGEERVVFANRVTVEAEGRTLSGCGGTLASCLTGADWTVTVIGGQAAAGLRPVTLRFEEGGRSGGQGPCNTHGGD